MAEGAAGPLGEQHRGDADWEQDRPRVCGRPSSGRLPASAFARHLRTVPTEDGQKLAEDQSLLFMETSALEGEKVEDAFNVILTGIWPL